MKLGVLQLDDSSQFRLDFQTRVGSVDCLCGNATQSVVFGYSAQAQLLNNGDAYLRYGG